MNTNVSLLKGARLLRDNEVPQKGDWAKWSSASRDEWREVGPMLIGLPVATLRVRCGQPSLKFCTFTH